MELWTIRRVIGWTRERFAKARFESPRLDAEVLLAHALGQSRLQLYLEHDRVVAAPELDRFRELVTRRLDGEPVAYLVGRKEFWSLEFHVDPRALIPRAETEALVEEALHRLQGCDAPRIVDVGTGSGAVACAIKKERPDAQLWATDISDAALSLARENALRLGLAVEFVQANLLDGLPKAVAPIDMIVANPPYLRPDEVRHALRFEPRIALTAEDNGFALTERLIGQAPDWLSPKGWLAVEVSAGHEDEIQTLFERTGQYGDIHHRRDLAGIDRVVSSQRRVDVA